MKEAEKFLKDNKLSDELLNWDDDERQPIYMSEIMQKYTNQQLIIHDVSQQRELLKVFRLWYNNENEGGFGSITNRDIDNYLKSL
jgi:hypothetical protein